MPPAAASPRPAVRQAGPPPPLASVAPGARPDGLATAPAGEVLLVTAESGLAEAVARLAALAGRTVAVVEARAITRPRWDAASLALVGAESAAPLAARRLSRRHGVLVVGRGGALSDDEPELLRAALEMGAEDVLLLPSGEARLLRCLAAGGRAPRAALVGVVGARGGAGATTLACALGVTAARQGLRTALVDADPLGGGVDLALGTEDAPGVRWSQLLRSGHAGGGTDLTRLLPEVAGLRLLSCDDELVRGDESVPSLPSWSLEGEPGDIAPAAVAAVLAALRPSLDLVVIDVPRQWSLGVGAGLDLLDAALLVTPAEVRATAAAVRVLRRLRRHVDDIRLVVRGPAPGGLPAEVVADALGLRLAAELPPERGLDEAYDRGLPPARKPGSPLAIAARSLLAALPVREPVST